MKPRPASKDRVCIGCRRPLGPGTASVRIRWRRPLCAECLVGALAQVAGWPRMLRQLVTGELEKRA